MTKQIQFTRLELHIYSYKYRFEGHSNKEAEGTEVKVVHVCLHMSVVFAYECCACT